MHMAAPAGATQDPNMGMGGMMMPMMVILGMMLAVSIIPGMRTGLSDAAALVIEPTIPFHDVWFIPTVFIIGTSIMVVNTIIRAFFTDPITQVHNQHRNKQISAQLRDAQSSRDNARAEKMRTLQMHMMPESMKQQGDQMRPVMFTIVFIFAIFNWMAESSADFRVDYVSLPWEPMWDMNNRILWILPAWVITYISMSAPLGRIIDRHLKIIRFSRHPLVIAGDLIPEPLLHLLKEDKSTSSLKTQRSQRRTRDGPRKTGETNSNQKSGNQHSAPPKSGTKCKSCNSTLVSRTTNGRIRCEVCRNEWR